MTHAATIEPIPGHYATISRVTRNSANCEVLRKQCAAAVEQGGFFVIKEEWVGQDWWTTFAIYHPERGPCQ